MSHERGVQPHLTSPIIKAFYHVYNTLGYGFLENVYKKSLVVTLRKYGMHVFPNLPIDVFFEEVKVGFYVADLLVNNNVIVEVKSVDALHPAHEAQLLNYLKATNVEIGLLLNFGPQAEIRRKIFSNDKKVWIPDDSKPKQ